MSEKRKACLVELIKWPGLRINDTTTERIESIGLPLGDTAGIKIEYFRAQEWEPKYPQEAFRLRINGRWHDDNGNEEDMPKGFLSFQAAQRLAQDIKTNLLDLPKSERLRITPDMVPKGTSIRVWGATYETTMRLSVCVDPYLDQHGQWCVMAYGYGVRKSVPLHEIMEVVK